ncbi:MAG: hypothetical protein M3Y87_00515 [Myxococcota bacterium]|nr:hypothetical protein [Myxococcota bacterium]
MNVPAQLGEAELRGALDALKTWLMVEVDRPYTLVVDIERVGALGAKERKLIAEYEKSYQRAERRFSTGQAFVATSQLVRGMMTAIFWLSPPVYPYRWFERRDDAERWAASDLAEGLADFPDGPYWRRRNRAA